MSDLKMSGLFDPSAEHDACGIGAVININGAKTHDTVDNALKIVEKLEHRAGKDAAGETGDGVGIMVQICHDFFVSRVKDLGIKLGKPGDWAVGMFFFPQDRLQRQHAKKMMELIAKKEGLKFLGWRTVPTRPEVLGEKALAKMPYIEQGFIERSGDIEPGLAFDRKLYVVRRSFEQSNKNTYIPSLSSRTIVYKGMFLVSQLRPFYPDLDCEDYVSALALVHSRFSTNTNPSWERAHPNRIILHNGEINTIRGNVDRMFGREETMFSSVMAADMDKVLPVISSAGSDSAMMDNTLEFLMMNGISLPLAVMMLIPEPWRKNKSISRTRRDLYRYYSTMMEPWDGPVAMLFSDGDIVGAVLDRNGLRPARYYVTTDDCLIISSEVGVLDIPPEKIACKARLRPGKMLLVDLKKGRIIDDDEIKETLAARRPYGEWLDNNLVHLKDLPIPNMRVPACDQAYRDKLYKAFGYSYDDVKNSLLPMAENGSEATAAMGVDIPLAVLSEKHQSLFSYFKQQFAQVTNPPIDAIREEIVTDTSVYIGADGNLLEEKAENCAMLRIDNPILTSVDLMKIKNMKKPQLKAETVSILYYRSGSLKNALDRMFIDCDKAYRKGANILILSDRGVDENHVAIPSLLAVSALEQYLIKTKKRTAISVILESAEPRDVHHFAALLSYGARAINPYLAQECIGEMIENGMLNKDYYAAVEDYNHAVLSGVLKIASKMGISTIQSYQSAQIFEIIGIKKDVVDEYFTNTISRVGGVGLEEIAEGVEWRHSRAFDFLGLDTDSTLDTEGYYRLRSGAYTEDHMYSPEVILTLQEATRTGDYSRYSEYKKAVDNPGIPHTLRGLLEINFPADGGIPIDEVEPADEIMKRFRTGAMSYGSISEEAHTCLAKAMNTIGGLSNSGEGGERPERLQSDTCSAIKQVASGRFGVTSQYLMSAKEIQIKMSQGAKPGEGGHLPGSKVYPWIAETRYSTPGVSLISPPPHHDIYSIEDLAQLIYDLKNANMNARISVKLAAETGVGTIAVGVAKAGAQVVLISGYDGGTGAAPRSSIPNAGMPWELGLAEAHQTLIENGLRTRVSLETDGKLMTGRDVAIAAMLGAEGFGFATAPLVSIGCMMMRVCNLDTCPAGIATQNPELRKNFRGKPEYVINFMRFIAEDLREIMAKLGVRTVNELVGRSDLLSVREHAITYRAAMVDMSAIIAHGDDSNQHFDPTNLYNFGLEKTKDMELLKKLGKNLISAEPKTISIKISSTDRTLGTILGSEITKMHAGSLPDDTFTVRCEGGAGQSFGAFIPKGLTMVLEGDSNDYFGKGLSGGKLIVYPPKKSIFKASENVIIGNVALYGATSGEAYIAGCAGERFAVRNSGAKAVVEGTGEHGCEYMTGGCVVVLGKTGKNFAAGMSGGTAYVLDDEHDLYLRVNKQLVLMEPVSMKHDIAEMREMIENHVKLTGSELGRKILDDFENFYPLFKKITPVNYAKMTKAIAEYEEIGMDRKSAELEAFYKTVSGGAE